MSDTRVPFDRLLLHRDWLRSVARALAADDAAADDLLQETWLEALRSPPRDERNVRGWLRTVIRNRARKRARAAGRRASHELAAAADAVAAPAAADVVATAEAEQRLAAAVLALDEPYRTAILLRFHERLPPRDVATRTGVPVATVRTRVRRGAERLRAALGGDAGGWLGAVTPILGATGSPTAVAHATTAGVVAMQIKANQVIVATLVAALFGGLGGAAFLVMRGGHAPLPAPETTALVATARTPDARTEPAAERRRVTPPPPVAPESAPVPSSAPPAQEPPPPRPPKPDAAAAEPHLSVPDEEPSAGEGDTDAMREDRASVREKYESADGKAGYTFHDLAYWVHVTKLEDSRWTKLSISEPRHDRGLQLRARWENPASAVPGMSIDVVVLKLNHYERGGRERIPRTPYTYPFNRIGKAVSTDDFEALLSGFYEEWTRGAKDVDESACEDPTTFRGGVRMRTATAVGTNAETGERERHEWYAWLADDATYVIDVTYAAALVENDALRAKGVDFVRNIREIKDKRVLWPE